MYGFLMADASSASDGSAAGFAAGTGAAGFAAASGTSAGGALGVAGGSVRPSAPTHRNPTSSTADTVLSLLSDMDFITPSVSAATGREIAPAVAVGSAAT